MASQISYVEWHTLETRGPVDPGPEEEVEGTLLVGPPVLRYSEGHISYGCDRVRIYPAFHNGERCWVKRATWEPEYGYSASGTYESILSFEEGVKIFLERGVFEFPAPLEKPAEPETAVESV